MLPARECMSSGQTIWSDHYFFTEAIPMKNLVLFTLLLAAAGCASQSAMVYKSDGVKQCEGGGTSLVQSKSELTDAGVEVFDSQCGALTGMAVMAVCGGPTLSIHVHEINARHLQRAERLGFTDTHSLIGEGPGTGFETIPCSD